MYVSETEKKRRGKGGCRGDIYVLVTDTLMQTKCKVTDFGSRIVE